MYFKSLQIMRGLAAVAVMLFHTQEYLRIIGGAPDTLFRVFGNGFSYGVYFFFGLSGFLMAYLIETGYDRFLPRRLLRIYPTFWLAACGTIVLKVLVFDSVSNPGLAKALTLLPFAGPVNYPLGVEWTLIYEVFFYGVCAVFTVASLRRFFPHFLLAWLGALVIANQVFQWPTQLLPTVGDIGFSLYNLLFVTGGLTYHVFRKIDGRPGALMAACAAVALASFLAKLAFTSPIAHFALMSTGCSALILLGALWDRGGTKPARPSLMEQLGDNSYGLYLVHVTVIAGVLTIATSRGVPCTTAVGAVAAFSALVAGWYYGKLDLLLQRSFKRFSKPAVAVSAIAPRSVEALQGPHRLRGDRLASALDLHNGSAEQNKSS